jgi:hypothetical protein
MSTQQAVVLETATQEFADATSRSGSAPRICRQPPKEDTDPD